MTNHNSLKTLERLLARISQAVDQIEAGNLRDYAALCGRPQHNGKHTFKIGEFIITDCRPAIRNSTDCAASKNV